MIELWKKLSLVLIFIISLNGVFLFFTGNKGEIFVESVIAGIAMLRSMKIEVLFSSSLWGKPGIILAYRVFDKFKILRNKV